MIKFILILVTALAIGWCAGYRVHAQNLPYYFKIEDSGSKSEIRLTNGSVITGVIEEETDQSIKLNTDGVRMVYKKSEIESMKTGLPPDFWGMLKKNYDDNHKERPLFTHRKEDTLNAKWDHAVLEPSRIADDIKKKNPGFSMTDEVERAMAANARARQLAYQKQKEQETYINEMEQAASNSLQY